MKDSFLKRLFLKACNIGASVDDSDELRLQKSLLVICSIPFMVAGTAWGIMYYFFGEPIAAIIPLSYSVFSLISLIYFGYTHHFSIYRFSQLMLILLLPFFLMWALGGFVRGSVVILWGLNCPLGALLFEKPTNAPRWLVAYLVLLVTSVVIQPLLPGPHNLTWTQINLFFLINLAAVSALIFMMVYYFVRQKNYYQAQSDSLLLNILPAEIAKELKQKGSAEAKHFNEVTVMFTDFKDFSRITEKVPPGELVAEIDYLFKTFDNIISKYSIEKIKTIGDAYMCAGGLPVPKATHAIDIVQAAIEILEFIETHLQERIKQHKDPFEIRIGIHTGPVVAGIVGDKKFAYDIWGDTVNIASRMESSGEPGKINISGSTYALVKDKIHCTHRGKIKAKNKGEIDMYFVNQNYSAG